MKIISDIRLFHSTIANIDGNPLPSNFSNKQLNTTIHRIVMKLREQGFSLGEFDHLYLNFTTCMAEGIMQPANRSIDPYHKWYRYYDIGVSQEVYDRLDSDNSQEYVIEQLQELLVAFFTSNNTCSIQQCLFEAVDKGEEMLMLYKTKQASKFKASIYLQYMDDGQYIPHLIVWNFDGEEVLHEKLKSDTHLSAIGDIQLSSKRVAIKPRKNSLTTKISPVVFEL